jgi:hypothetical protein
MGRMSNNVGRRVESVFAWAAAIALIVIVVGIVGWFALFMWGIRMRDVGPDADEMAKDPVLHIEVEDAIADEIYADTGSEGGVMPAMANRTSEAFRHWTLETTDWQATLLAAVAKVNEEDVTWQSLWCSSGHVRFVGIKDVVVGDDLVSASVSVSLRGIDGTDPLQLAIRLDSDGESDAHPLAPPDPAVTGECPTAVVETFTSVQT